MSSSGRTPGVVALVALVIASTVTACSSSSKHAASAGGAAGQVLSICTDVPNKPMEYEGPGPRRIAYTGFDIELFDAMAQKLNRRIVVRPVHPAPFDKIFDDLSGPPATACDVIVSSVTIREPRKKVVAFTDPYFAVDQSVLVKRGSAVRSAADLAGKTVGVLVGTAGQATARTRLPAGASFKGFADAAGLLGALDAGSVQAVFQDLPANANLVIEDKTVMIVATFPTAERYGFAVRQDRTALVDQLNTALAQVRADGTYRALYDKYFRRG